MPYALNPKFIDHIVLMVKNVYKSEVFYSKFLGKPISKDKYSIAYKIGGTKLFFAIPFKHIKSNTFNRNRLGLNHIAFGVSSLKTLKNIENRLNKAKIKNSGIILDKYKQREYIWLDDPDGIRQEFYLRYPKEK
ncbi:hypothetical protein A2W54_01095 [Candidatus Giovannonibacteria bacterium RIFCSPHIGHO2_02_43_13]|uniref:VOC domain-containing protein n=1 Tax=Candidatus Giovannonibacteria bacterium RIFCSPHIGHO2_02_43_13 TaxID=1798330 RepID=A0A1F5WU03_9BACT|nr:MAG: Glyoxalase/bleomycin resistance protein/dioxygenase [Parcubacteria group bacterium GW2011_GWA2_44_13]OGF73094.1 MAG: hypothetical protein A3E06_01125 [Candidatus Giovannonibacteria bacterium RIFCSPHIGHO2_12_FULL_44_42]OGF79129.1 MAG: hypothetical protein A2W54_01095 [Candidatus Giovannonibacteria bacterium RIFCSPHIGHO2_02_43_13]OGF88933.1 MAG: hypothetical protein A3I94_00965 [Candidatus Giovannonibacteria bacterium RIFCSPLOWO2_02_FULL_43_54]OGF97280.1 MAG: hypothetical protein A3H08_00